MATIASITKQPVGKYTYLYESVSYRDDLGRPRNRKTKIGKINPATGQPIYTPEYLEKTRGNAVQPCVAAGTDTVAANLDIERILDGVKDFGVYRFLRSVAEKIGLWAVLQRAFPSAWQGIFTLACYLIVSDKPVMYCDDWLEGNEWMDVGSMSSQRVSDLLADFGEAEKNTFHREWCRHIREAEYIALDITSVSSY